jgi:hypothetical protein
MMRPALGLGERRKQRVANRRLTQRVDLTIADDDFTSNQLVDPCVDDLH